MQLHKLHKHALELEQSGGRRGRAEAEGLGGGKRWVEKGKGGRTMTDAQQFHLGCRELGFVSNLILWCCPMVPVIILLHVICCPFEHSLHLLLGMIQSSCEGVHSLHCQCLCRLYSQVWVLTGIKLKWGLMHCCMDLVVVCKLC